MRMVFGLVLVLGLGLAGFAVYMAQNFIAQTQYERDLLLAAQKDAPQLVEVVVATRAVKYGERLQREDFGVVRMEAGKTPEGVFNAIEAPQEEGSPLVPIFYSGERRPRAALRSFEINEPIIASKITAPGVDAGITANLTPGMRAFAINVDVSSGVSGFLRPGDRVDVYWSGGIGGKDVTKLIQTGIRLIAIDQSADSDRSDETLIARTVTVEANPRQVAALAQAQNTGRLSLSLLGTGDVQVSEAVEIDQNTLLGIEEREVVQYEEERICTIRTNRGGELVETEIPCTD